LPTPAKDLTSSYWELRYPLTGTLLPTDHGYRLYSAISHQIPAVHELTNWSMATIGGKPNGHREILLTESSRLRIRTTIEQVPMFLKLVQKLLKIDLYSIVPQPPDIHPISPYPTLKARLVIIKGFQEPEPFIRAVKYQLQKLEIDDRNVYIPHNNLGLPDRKAMKVHKHKVIGFSVIVDKLDPIDSIALQMSGCGGKQKMGCGFFTSVSIPNNEQNTETKSSNT
jgi:CRISPR-associated protein Cas6